MKLYRKVRGWIRLWIWGVCPQCNHDAPELYDCTICDYYRNLPRYRINQEKEVKKAVWHEFKNKEL